MQPIYKKDLHVTAMLLFVRNSLTVPNFSCFFQDIQNWKRTFQNFYENIDFTYCEAENYSLLQHKLKILKKYVLGIMCMMMILNFHSHVNLLIVNACVNLIWLVSIMSEAWDTMVRSFNFKPRSQALELYSKTFMYIVLLI